ncbi:hypothetical protein [Neolewinella antarctica]|uniref:Uncharacterized protein n=1 Tax=Neolewinella antarctica TaxID=442734 RepID=A0ABX0X8F8_9BACT|nr:hypothetical protein [Neolewinella antarctica]NJC25539.1 hypothetical protein [Neolewinella antarctica]
MVAAKRTFYLLLSTLILGTAELFAQADQESPFQVNETVTKGEQGIGSTIWVVLGIIMLLAIFFLIKKGGSGETRAGNPK